MKYNFYIVNNDSNCNTQVWLMNSQGNISHACDVAGIFIFDINLTESIPLKIETLDIICASIYTVSFSTNFYQYFHAVQFIPHNKIKFIYKNLMC